ncbi:biopolymer transporter ExbD [Bremerella cremea]|uniref:Biopolymer transporter ExbD n=1 Tax=Bremerella cremea TaxID=1031537 RepID=A0A368KJI4_9BACT|nr:biopolymer transporter ExbD [Bremerella cremea]RCS40731.1 biopolymer transporter ExbD [Bremerella cremea]
MKRPSPYRDRQPLQIAMTPMIDVVFLLLVFFLWTASFQIVEYALPSSITPPNEIGSEAEKPLEVEDFDEVVVRITGQPGQFLYTINKASTSDLSEVENRLAALASIKNDIPLIIDPDDSVPIGRVIDVYDMSRRLNFQQIQFAVEPG